MSTIPVAPRWALSAYRSSLRNYTGVANQSVFRVSDGFRERLIAAQDFVGFCGRGGISWTSMKPLSLKPPVPETLPYQRGFVTVSVRPVWFVVTRFVSIGGLFRLKAVKK
jgi:hypothetical protein